MQPDIIGWAASLILLLTIGYQVCIQWRAGTSKGVSPWLFIGQLIASSTFAVYSFLIESTVFIVTNSLLALSAVIGLSVCFIHRRRDQPKLAIPSPTTDGPASAVVHHLGLAVKDFDASLAFYHRALDVTPLLTFKEHGLRVALVNLADGCQIELFETPDSPAARHHTSSSAEDGRTATPGELIHFALSVNDVDRTTQHFVDAGARVQSKPENMTLGESDNPASCRVRFSFVRGPDDELIELIGFKGL